MPLKSAPISILISPDSAVASPCPANSVTAQLRKVFPSKSEAQSRVQRLVCVEICAGEFALWISVGAGGFVGEFFGEAQPANTKIAAQKNKIAPFCFVA